MNDFYHIEPEISLFQQFLRRFYAMDGTKLNVYVSGCCGQRVNVDNIPS